MYIRRSKETEKRSSDHRKCCWLSFFSCQGFREFEADLSFCLEHHSLNLATKEMGMAYSKAWTILKSAEEALGIRLLYRMGGNGSVLTKEGEELLEVYEEAEKAAQKAAVEVLREHYGKEIF